MVQWIVLIAMLAEVFCRPHVSTQQQTPAEAEKPVETFPNFKHMFEDSRKQELTKVLIDNIKEILEKTNLVNENSDFNNKRKSYPLLPYSVDLESQDDVDYQKISDFTFPRGLNSNILLDYIVKNYNADSNKKTTVIENNNEQNSIGDYIKRKIIHQQTIISPAFSYVTRNIFPSQTTIPQYFFGVSGTSDLAETENSKKNNLETQTIENIKHLIANSQLSPSQHFSQNSNIQTLFPQYLYEERQNLENLYTIYSPYPYQQLNSLGKQQWQWPLEQYFPIIIKDPFVHMMNAFMSMVEYGPQAAPGNVCNKDLEKQNLPKQSRDSSPNAENVSNRKRVPYSIIDNDIENLQHSDSRIDLSIKRSRREIKQNEGNENLTKSDVSKSIIELLKNSVTGEESTKINQYSNPRHSPSLREETLFEDEIMNGSEEKSQDVRVFRHGTKKLVSKDNTGSGIFLHRINVRKGGVAIAGPGGIATAGSGGTAIVGPNGFAYTHPDSLAIAGSGTKVIAVEPTVDLLQVALDHDQNRTRGNDHFVPRLGKVVAVGPVIYYNRG